MPDVFASLINNGREERNLEYKRTMNWSDAVTKVKLVKSSIAMANLRDGGTIVFGIERQPDDSYSVAGMNRADYDSFKQDDVSVEVNNYAEPFIELNVLKVELDGMNFVLVQVREFVDLPIICKRDGAERLRSGAMYIRPRRKHETTELLSQVDMREILDLAVEKRVRSLYSQIERVGARLVFPQGNASKAFIEQLGEL
jgi:predicted HTH transcriptional regulator